MQFVRGSERSVDGAKAKASECKATARSTRTSGRLGHGKSRIEADNKVITLVGPAIQA